MCLVTKQTEPFTAKKSFVVWKVLTKWNQGPNRPSYYYMRGRNRAEQRDYEVRKDPFYTYVYGGFLHAFISKSSAKNMAETFNHMSKSDNFKVVRMHVPEGATFYVGNAGDICSDVLVWKSGPAREKSNRLMLEREEYERVKSKEYII